ncbi:PQQ-binding-like beta-propeller repeat protein [Streptomyces sp. NPDC088864]|uniref:outer membrane protein assembly factor BamB family protein n=1 Tax=Streptomyces sp. NPDC088864 TaxID=3365910 RepID=UPI0038125360
MRGKGGVRRWAAATAAVALAAGALTACGDGGGGAAGAKASGKTGSAEAGNAGAGGAGDGAGKQPGRRSFDPPVQFGGDAVDLPGAGQPGTASGQALRPAVTLVDGVAYIGGESGIKALDTRTGRSRWQAETENEADRGGFGTKRMPPLVAADGRTVYAAWNRRTAAEGTAPSRSVVEVMAVDTATGKKTWSAEIPADPSSTGLAARPIGADENLAPQVVGVDAGTAIVTAADTTYALDPASGDLRWKRADYRAVNLADGVVAGGERTGYQQGRLLGLDAGTGKERWTVADAREPANASPALLSADRGENTIVVDAAGGKNRVLLEGHGWRCLHDARSLVACSRDREPGSDHAIVVFEAATFRQKWTLPDHSGRSVPRMTGFWHGALYGDLSGSPVVLDGVTGKDRETEPYLAPVEIDRYGGVEGTRYRPATR